MVRCGGGGYTYKSYNTDIALCINSMNVGSGTACMVMAAPGLGLILVTFPKYFHVASIVCGYNSTVTTDEIHHMVCIQNLNSHGECTCSGKSRATGKAGSGKRGGNGNGNGSGTGTIPNN